MFAVHAGNDWPATADYVHFPSASALPESQVCPNCVTMLLECNGGNALELFPIQQTTYSLMVSAQFHCPDGQPNALRDVSLQKSILHINQAIMLQSSQQSLTDFEWNLRLVIDKFV
jgi:hypothetical protein